MENDPKVLVMGEDVGKLGGVFRVTDGLQKDFGEDRVIDTPLAESGIVGTAIGLALRGYRPVCEIQFDGFVFPAYDQIVTQLAKMRDRSRGQVKLPVVVRIPYGGGIGAVEHHSESPEAFFAHTAGLRIVSPREPRGRLLDDPAGDRQRRPGDLLRAQAPLLGQGRGRRRRAGPRAGAARRPGGPRRASDVTLAATARWCRTALEAADGRRGDGTSIEVVDLRSLSPLDFDTPRSPRSRRPRRLVVVHEAPVFLGLGRGDRRPDHRAVLLPPRGPVLRVGGFHAPYPPAGWRRSTCPTSTGCSTPSTAPWRTEERRTMCRTSSSSACPTRARASPRPRSSRGTSSPATP